MNSGWIYTAIFVTVLALWVIGHTMWAEHQHRKVARKLEGRPVVSAADYGATYYPDNASRAGIANTLVAMLKDYGLPEVQQLTPDDRLVDYQLFEFDSMGAVWYALEIEKHYQISIPDEKWSELQTLHNIIVYIEDATAGKKLV